MCTRCFSIAEGNNRWHRWHTIQCHIPTMQVANQCVHRDFHALMTQLSQRSPLDAMRSQDLICRWVGDWPCVPFIPPYNPANFVPVIEAPRPPNVYFLMGAASFQIVFELQAGVAQLAEHNVANVVVVGSNPITRS